MTLMIRATARAWVACVVVAAGVLAAGRAHAADPDYARPGFYLGAGGTYAFHWFAGHEFDDDLGGPGVQVISGRSFGFNLQGGYRFNRWLAAELEYEWLDGFTNKIHGQNVATLQPQVIMLNGRFLYPAWGRFQPFAQLGIGAAVWQTRDRSGVGAGLESTAAGVAGKVGLGIDAYLTEHWLATLGLDITLTSAVVENSIGGDLKNLFYVPIQFGVQYRF